MKEECCSRTEVGITGNLLCCSGRQVFTVFAPTLVLEMHPFFLCVCVILYEFVMKYGRQLDGNMAGSPGGARPSVT